MQLSDADRARVSAAIREAETQTSGEIYCVKARACSDYRVVPLAWSALVGLAVPLPLIYLTHWPVSIIYFMQLAAFGLCLAGLSHPDVRYRIVPARMKQDRAHAEALRQFAAHGLHKTERRTGVLIFVSAAERYAEIVADAGIDRKVEQGAWDGAIGALIGAIKDGRAADGFVAAIEQCTRVLAVHFPPGALDRNELPNAIVEL
jgi:putative membrane protein